VSSTLKVHITVYVIGSDVVDIDKQWKQLYTPGDKEAILVRPDGYVAWRSGDKIEEEALRVALATVLGRSV
jgi:putative polyketide hydroxylase